MLAIRTVFTLDLTEGRPERGQYKVTVSATLERPQTRIPSAANAVFTVHVLTNAVIDFVDIGSVDADQTTQGKLVRYVHGVSSALNFKKISLSSYHELVVYLENRTISLSLKPYFIF